MVSGVSSSTDAAASSSAASSAATSLAGDFNTFLTMLTTQLKHQDLTSPMDSNEFTQQLVQFSQVEQQIDRKSTRLNSSHYCPSRVQSYASKKKQTNDSHNN